MPRYLHLIAPELPFEQDAGIAIDSFPGPWLVIEDPTADFTPYALQRTRVVARTAEDLVQKYPQRFAIRMTR